MACPFGKDWEGLRLQELRQFEGVSPPWVLTFMYSHCLFVFHPGWSGTVIGYLPEFFLNCLVNAVTFTGVN